MTPATAGSDTIARPAPKSSLWLIVSWTFALAAAALFLFNGVRYADETQTALRTIPDLEYSSRVDYAYFHAGASLAWHGDAAELYPEPNELTFYPGDPPFLVSPDSYAKARLLARGNYYNPPLMAFLQSPLSTLSFRDSFWVFSLISLGLLGGYVGLAVVAGRNIVELPLLVMGSLAFKPVHEAIIMGHWSMLFLLAITAGLLALRANKPVLTGLCFSLLALKPQWAILPGLFLLVRGEWRALGTMAAGCTLVFFSGFVITGPHTFWNYVHFVRWQNGIDLKDAPHMFSWNGFLFKLQSHAPDTTLIYSLVAVTAALLLAVWRSRDFYLGAAATVLAMLLVSTHSVWYDWSLLVVAGLFVLLRPNRSRSYRIESWIVLIAMYVAASQSVAELLYPGRYDVGVDRWYRPAFFSLTPVAFAALAWLVTVAFRDGLLSRPFALLGSPKPKVAGTDV